MRPQLRPRDLISILSISQAAAYELCSDPSFFPAYKATDAKNSSWLIDPDELERWQKERQQQKNSQKIVVPLKPSKKKSNKKSSKRPEDYKLTWPANSVQSK